MDDFSPGLEALFEGVDMPLHAHHHIKQRDSPPVFSSPSTASSHPSPDSSFYSPRQKLTIDKWDAYHPTTRLYFPLFDQNYQLVEAEIRTKIDKLSNISANSDLYSSVDDAYILYRQNQFELEVTVPALPTQLYVQYNSSYIPVESFYFHLYAVKQTRKDDTGIPIVDNEEVVEIIQHLSAREKKEVQVPPPMLVVNGQVIFSRLQFKSATMNNARANPDQPHPNQQYFRLILSLVVKIEDTFHFVMSRISPRLILRGRNPGNFQHSPSHEVPAPAQVEPPPNSRQKRQRVPQHSQPTLPQTPLTQSPEHIQSQQQSHLQLQQQLQQQQLQQQLQHQQQLQQQQLLLLQAQQEQHSPQHSIQFHTQRQVQLQLQQEMIQQQDLQQQYLLQQQLQLQQQQQPENELNLSPLMPIPTQPPPYLPPQAHPLQQQSLSLPAHINQSSTMISLKREQDDAPLQPLTMSQIHQSHIPPQTSAPLLIDDQEPSSSQPRKSQKRNFLDTSKNQPNTKEIVDDGWQMDSKGNIFISGKVGINTLPTEEALTVHGNVLVTGNYLKPSDERVKTNIKKLDGKTQLENIEKLQLYEYDLKHEIGKDGASVHEAGVLAQELRKVLPQAVQVLQNVTLADGTIMPELLVVQDRALLYENIGATKQLGAEVRKNQANLTALQKRTQDLKAATNRAFAALGRSMDYLLTETGDDSREDIKGKACYCTLFGLGPAWTIYFLGFFLPLLWLCGVFYISSFSQVKKMAGFFSAVTLCVYIAYVALIFSSPVSPITVIAAPLAIEVLGVLLLCIIAMSWGLKKQRRKYYKFTKKNVHKARLRKELGEVNEALQEEADV